MKYVLKYWNIIALLCIVSFALFLRVYKLGSIPGSLYIDEVAIGVDAKAIAETGKDMHGGSWLTTAFPSYGDFKLPVYIWASAVSIRMFGVTDFAVRFPSALAGILSVIMVYLITIELFQKDEKQKIFAVCAALMVAIMPWSIQFSRTGFESHVGQFFVLVAIWSALQGKKHVLWYVLSVSFGVVAVYTYYSVRFVFPPVCLAVFLTFLPSMKKMQRVVLGLGMLLVFVLGIYPMTKSQWYSQMEHIRFSTKNVLDMHDSVEQSNALRDLSNRDVFSKLFYHRYAIMGRNLISHYFDYLDPQFLFVSGDTNLRHNTGEVGIMLLGMMPMLGLGMFTIAKRYPKIGFVLLTWFVFGILPAAVPYDTPHALRSLNALGAIAIVLGVGLGELISVTRDKMRVISLLCVLLLFLNFALYWHDYTSHYPERSEGKWWAMSKRVVGQFVGEQKSTYQNIEITANDKMFLWIAWYGGISTQSVQSAKEVDFIKLSLDNISFQTTLRVNPEDKNVLYIAEASQLQDNARSKFLTQDATEPFRYVESQQ